MYHAIKQLEERNVANEIDILLWSDRMDLVAFSNLKGEVALHRLSWTRAWLLGPPKEGLRVKGMAWRPDGKVLAIAYSSGEILLLNVENKNTLHHIQIEGNIVCISWVCEKTECKATTSSTFCNNEEPDDYMTYLDYSSKYLPELPPLSNLGHSVVNTPDDTVNNNLFNEQKELNLLIVGTGDGCLHISIFGQFPCAILNLNNYLENRCSIVSVHFSDDLSLMYVTVRDDLNSIKIVIVDTSVLKTHAKELFAVALKHGKLNNLITYLSNVIIPMKETWETILMEMDAKLSKYASKVPEGTLTGDFLDLLMFGITSEEMQEFLLQDLTEKGLKKFGQVIEMCYTNIQKLLLKNVMKAGQNISFHLVELRGMARLEHRYKVVGLSEDVITKAIGSNGAFLTKGGEMHQIINHFTISYKAFFRWLYTAIMHLMDLQMLPDMPKNSQQDINHIMEFILNFDNIGVTTDDEKSKFTMERLGQYLNDSPLSIPPNTENNLWASFLSKNKCIESDVNIIKHYKNYSLIQQFKHLVVSIEDIFAIPKSLIAEQFALKNLINCIHFDGDSLRITKINFNNELTFVAMLNKSPPAEGIYSLEIDSNSMNIKGGYFYFKPSDSNNCAVLDVKYYSTSILSVLLQENNRNGILFQFSVASIREKLRKIENVNVAIQKQTLPIVNGMELGLGMQKHIDGMVCSQFAVSGCRRVSIVLSENCKKVRLFEMEAEEDDEEDADMTNSARESDTSMQEESSIVE